MGTEKCRRRASEHIYLLGINTITEMVESCVDCQMYSRKNTPEPLKPHEVPTRAWQKVGTDLFSCDGKDYFVIVDYVSEHPELLQLKTTSSNATCTAYRTVFARYGVPDAVMGDNCPQCNAKEFADFAKGWEFEQVTSGPHYPESNSTAESAVKAMKNIVIKSMTHV